MIRTEKCYCDLCGEAFDTEEECIEHERTHYTNWEEADNSKIAAPKSSTIYPTVSFTTDTAGRF